MDGWIKDGWEGFKAAGKPAIHAEVEVEVMPCIELNIQWVGTIVK